MCVAPIAARDDDESVPDFKIRARAILAERGGGCIAWGAPEDVEWVDAEPDPEPEVLTIKGGLKPDPSGDFATYGDVTVDRKPGESVEDFQRRARGSAQAAGVEWVVFGGLPRMNVITDDVNLKGE